MTQDSRLHTKQTHTRLLEEHEWRPISFTLVVDDFRFKYIEKEHTMHLIRTLKQHYKVEEDWERQQYLGITLD
jgi:hypothetical protein